MSHFMSQGPIIGAIFLALHILVQIALIVRVLLRPHREPASRIAWIVVIIAVPGLGILAYILLGETNIGRRRVERLRKILSRLPDVAGAEGADATNLQVDVPKRIAHLFQAGKTVNGFDPVGGNRAHLMQD
jgi:cardiolipin synthase